MSDANTSTPASSVDNDKVMAAVATIPLIGLIIYFGMKDASEFVRFYAKQSIGLFVIALVISVVSFIIGFIPIIGSLLACISWLLWIVVGLGWVALLIGALQGTRFRLPVIADLVDQFIK